MGWTYVTLLVISVLRSCLEKTILQSHKLRFRQFVLQLFHKVNSVDVTTFKEIQYLTKSMQGHANFLK